MDETTAPPVPAPQALICPRCHFAVRPEFYYCPNCGVKLNEGPLPTDAMSQVLLYGFSIVLPMIAYLAITKWQGIKYLRSKDEKAKQMGMIALGLLIVSSIVMFWWTYVWIQGYINTSVSDLNNYGF